MLLLGKKLELRQAWNPRALTAVHMKDKLIDVVSTKLDVVPTHKNKFVADHVTFSQSSV